MRMSAPASGAAANACGSPADDNDVAAFRGDDGVERPLEQALAEVGGPAVCVLRHQRVEFATRSGVEVSYRKPVIDVAGRAEGGKGSVHLAA